MMSGDWIHEYFDDTYRRLFLDTVDPARTVQQVRQILMLCPLLPKAVILDVGCGLGRHSLVLARLGFRVTGVDMNPDYVARCQEQARLEGLDARFVTADSRTMTLSLEADLTLSLWSSFGYFGESAGDELVLKNMAKHTKTKGLVFVDVENRDYIIRHFVAEEWHEVGDELIAERRKLDIARGAVITRRIVEGPSGKHEYRRTLRMYTVSEMDTMITLSGLRSVQWYGDYDGSRLGPESKRMIVVAKR